MKIICIGRNYPKHIEELGNEKPEEPVLFMKADSSVLPKKNPFIIPPFSNQVEHEVEFVVKINKVGKHIDAKFAHKYYDEVGLGIDFTARDLQADLKSKGLPWEKAKSFDGNTVLGEFVDKTSFENLNNLEFSLKKNDAVVQKGNTNDMLWKVDELIAYVSQFFMLKKGDLIFTGTPAGVSKVERADVLEGMLEGKTMFSVKIK